MENIEKRHFSDEIRLLDEPNSRKIVGYAAVFGCESRDMGFTEFIDAGAFDGVLERSDVFAVLNHDPDKVLARCNKGKGTLKLSIDERGLRYEFDAPETDLGNSVLEFVKRSELTESSFAFVVEKDNWHKEDDGHYVRHIEKIASLHDVSPCWNAAYSQTSVSCRSFDEFKEKEARELAEQKAKEEEEARLEEERKTKEAIAQQHQKMLDEYAKYLPADNK